MEISSQIQVLFGKPSQEITGVKCNLTISYMQAHFDLSAVSILNEPFLLLLQCFQLYSELTFLYLSFKYLFLDLSKTDWYRFVVFGNELEKNTTKCNHVLCMLPGSRH